MVRWKCIRSSSNFCVWHLHSSYEPLENICNSENSMSVLEQIYCVMWRIDVLAHRWSLGRPKHTYDKRCFSFVSYLNQDWHSCSQHQRGTIILQLTKTNRINIDHFQTTFNTLRLIMHMAARLRGHKERKLNDMFIHFFCLCALHLTIKLNFMAFVV